MIICRIIVTTKCNVVYAVFSIRKGLLPAQVQHKILKCHKGLASRSLVYLWLPNLAFTNKSTTVIFVCCWSVFYSWWDNAQLFILVDLVLNMPEEVDNKCHKK